MGERHTKMYENDDKRNEIFHYLPLQLTTTKHFLFLFSSRSVILNFLFSICFPVFRWIPFNREFYVCVSFIQWHFRAAIWFTVIKIFKRRVKSLSISWKTIGINLNWLKLKSFHFSFCCLNCCSHYFCCRRGNIVASPACFVSFVLCRLCYFFFHLFFSYSHLFSHTHFHSLLIAPTHLSWVTFCCFIVVTVVVAVSSNVFGYHYFNCYLNKR